MATFAYSGRTRAGQTVTGERMAETMDAAVAALRREQVLVTQIQPLKDKAAKAAGTKRLRGRAVAAKNLAVFTRQFSVMIDAGLPLVQCLEILGTQEEDKHFSQVILATRAEVESGASLADAMAKHPKTFDPLFTNMIAAGEAGGILDTILKRLATYIEKNVKLARQVKGAMVYPVAILVIALVVVAALLKYVIPTFENMFADLGDAKLPALTQFVIGASHWFQANFIAIVVIGGASFYGFKWALRQEKGKEIFDTVMLKLPLFGPLLRKVAVAKFTRTLGTMIASGVPILDALDIVAKSAGNKVIERAIYFVREKISEGSNMAEPLAKTNVFPSMVVQMIAVGESTGAMDTMLQKIADFYEEEVEVAVGSLTKLLEPLMMVFIGGIVGTVLIAMYLPIFEIAGNVKTS